MAVALFHPNDSIGSQEWRYQDKDRGFSLIIPANWVESKFPLGPLALRVEINSGGYYASCSLTVVASNSGIIAQEKLDEAINFKPMSDSEQKYLVSKIMAESGDTLSNYYSAIQKFGNKKARTLFYNSTSYSEKLAANIYMESFYSFYVRQRDQVGITCMGGGASRNSAHGSFEKFNSSFQKIVSSIRFE